MFQNFRNIKPKEKQEGEEEEAVKVIDLIREKIEEFSDPISKGTWMKILNEKQKINIEQKALKNQDIELIKEVEERKEDPKKLERKKKKDEKNFI